MDLQLNGKRALVTGSSSGIGRAIAVALAAEGVAVLVHGRDAERAKATAAAIAGDGGVAAVVLADLTQEAETRLVVSAVEAFGGVDILVNNAAATGRDEGWLAGGADQWLHLYNANVASAVRLIGALTPAMRTARWGRVIQIGSAAHPYPLPMKAAYSATKAALSNLTVSLSKELAGTGVTANTISPGPALTDGFRDLVLAFARQHGMADDIDAATRTLIAGPLANPSDRLVRPHEIAALTALVASPLSGSVNGANLRIDGGFTPTVN
ncbi:NAD(P)-dependent dehydrogenase (short-subunit alcohol dehydrogenase family) [Kribbella aluminosa]|uniref:NAD(P)-dependent dehydrogenase (Short-subunit alcohol dehydrogenase family) n=1 Tax=Kribbella aluminosa TaxID=416017 RepID=A0ABS4UKU0_9ACTN|nr:SDR family NAD(P)-dependent oxidoreductase [Kribbella aluminosa]MBP2352166.1 NAD(P)-dependent dehydrogenase (short-subunit alcohol dehydrogenase family) [Kribbella aluminosa]